MSKRKRNKRVSEGLGRETSPIAVSGRGSMLKVSAPILILLLAAICFGAFLNFNSPLMSKSVSGTSAPVQPLPTPGVLAA